jgi:metallo-beta-lactamase class B
MLRRCLLSLLVFVFALPALAETPVDWTTALAPFQIADNLYYVGSRDLAAYLVTTSAGDILINANLPSSPQQIRASVEKLGFHWRDIKILLDGQAHFDHMGGAAEVLRETGAKDYVMDGDVAVARSGGRDDFAAPLVGPYPPVRVDHVLHDGEHVTLGGVTLVAHKTAGHTRGCTTWSMRVHLPGEPANKLRDVVILGGDAALSNYRFFDRPGKPASYPGIAADFAVTFRTLKALPCDVFLGAHGIYFDMLSKRARMAKEGDEVWIDPAGYQRAVEKAQQEFEAKLAKQRQD